MGHRAFAQHEPSIDGYPGPLAKILLKAADRFVVEPFGKQERIQVEFNRMQSQKANRKMRGFW
ncbi:hypothetical protein [Ensifer adhaerens]|uniref:hypothetical protein n=1 Tax=Ensifer adhaerens TaxID=106592 RepID=UPI000CF1B232|nr:hypothetical protein [Ensifer adhaerens]